MSSISFNLSDDHSIRLVDAVCGLHGYARAPLEPETGPTDETKQEFTQRLLREWLVGQVRRWEQSEAKRIADVNVTDIEVT